MGRGQQSVVRILGPQHSISNERLPWSDRLSITRVPQSGKQHGIPFTTAVVQHMSVVILDARGRDVPIWIVHLYIFVWAGKLFCGRL